MQKRDQLAKELAGNKSKYMEREDQRKEESCLFCIHREVCESWTTINLDDIPPEIPCGHFKDTADVAPRAEVAMEIFEELRRYIINHCYLADDDVDAIWKHIDKLEKKYTEDKK